MATSTKRAHTRKTTQTAGNNAPGVIAGAAAALAPYTFDEAQTMTYRSLKRNVETAQTALDRFLAGVREPLPNRGTGWILRADREVPQMQPPKVKAAAR